LRSAVLRRSTIALPLALALLLGACSAGASPSSEASSGDPMADCVRVEDGVITISANNLEFSAPCMVANAGEAFTIHFVNEEAIPHDVAVYREEARTNLIMRGEPINGPEAETDYDVEALDAGEYYFDCTIHPADMNGTLYVVEA
jgi:plastocyanin